VLQLKNRNTLMKQISFILIALLAFAFTLKPKEKPMAQVVGLTKS